MKTVVIVVLFVSYFIPTYGQKEGYVWCFGDSSGIDFNSLNNPVTIHSAAKSRGSSASISDSSGNLLFYSSYNPQALWGGSVDYNGEVYNRNHSRMPNGDLVITEAWYHEQVIIPDPGNPGKYYLFSINVTGGLGLFYSKIDMSLNSGMGDLAQKNILLESGKSRDCLTAIKHGNGRDWWIIWRSYNTANDEFHLYFVDSTGISGPFIQHYGSANLYGICTICFSPDGRKLANISYAGLIEIYDFDRCTGQLSNYQLIYSGGTQYLYYLWGCSFSPNNRFLYISSSGYNYPSFLYQFDTWDPNMINSFDTLWSTSIPNNAGGSLKLGPDGKIYFACAWSDSINFNYPYPDSVFNTINNNLSVINYPDSPGVACGFAPFSFNLGAGRCYWGLPNNPDYELGAVVNSMCDTVLSVDSRPLTVDRNSQLHVFYHPGWQIAFINAEGLKGKKYNLQVYDLFGRRIFTEEGNLNSEYFTKDLNCVGFAKGMYIVKISTENENLSKKFIKQ